MKKDLWYCILKNKTVDVVIDSEGRNFNICSYKQLLKDCPKSKYNYIKVDAEVGE